MVMNKIYYQRMQSNIILIVSMFFIIMTTVSCSKDSLVPDTLEIENPNPVVRANSGTLSIDVLSNSSWKVGKIVSTWLTVEKTDDDQLLLSYDENNTVESRTAEFFIVTTNDGKYHKITLTQLATDPFLELGLEEIEVGSRPRMHEIE